MTAQLIFDLVPIGAIVAWSDGTPRPSERHTRKLAAWRTNNGRGRLIRKEGRRVLGTVVIPAGFVLHESDLGSGDVVVMRIHRSFATTSALRFAVVERPPLGSARVFDRPGPNQELVHFAASRAEAEAWLAHHGHPSAVIDEVGAGEMVVADEGRVA
jgi:hypothetical protein